MPIHNRVCFANHMGEWLCEPQYFARGVRAVKSGLWQPRAAAQPAPAPAARAAAGDGPPPKPYEVTADGIAVIPICGVMMKGYSKYADCDTLMVRRNLRMAARDAEVSAILLLVDSPGGQGAGTAELAADVIAACEVKPVYAQIDDMGASAAYWVAAQARHVSANATAWVGSIGTYSVVEDWSKAYEAAKVTVHVIAMQIDGKNQPYKGAFTEGTEVTPEHLAYLQELVNDHGQHFLQAVASGRHMDLAKVKTAADGRLFPADKALSMGLIDSVRSLDATVSAIRADMALALAQARSRQGAR